MRDYEYTRSRLKGDLSPENLVMTFTLLTLKNKVTGEIRYTFEHWIKEDEYMTVVDRPSHKTQLLTNYDKDLFEVISREEYTE